MYLYQPVWSTDSCPHIRKVQHTIPKKSIVRLIREPEQHEYCKAIVTFCQFSAPVYFLSGHCEVNCVAWALVWPREVGCPTCQQFDHFLNSFLIWLVTAQAAHFNSSDLVHLRKCKFKKVVTVWLSQPLPDQSFRQIYIQLSRLSSGEPPRSSNLSSFQVKC